MVAYNDNAAAYVGFRAKTTPVRLRTSPERHTQPQ
jgi:hypothetical protein